MKNRGTGIAIGHYPTGQNGGGDPSQAMVKIQPDGSAVLTVGSCDLGQGCKTILAQMAAEVLGMEYEQVKVINHSVDNTPMSSGSYASRVTYVDGKATVEAAENAREILFQVAGEILEASPSDLIIENGKVFVKGDRKRFKTISKIVEVATYEKHKQVVGLGHFMKDFSKPDPETGECDPFCTLSWGVSFAEVEVDTDTGEVEVLRFVSYYDAGKAINPMLVEGQIQGGSVMGLGAALMEDLHPYYPNIEHQPDNLSDYSIPTTMDIPDFEALIYECPSTEGPYGAKGIGELSANYPSPAIINAIHDAIGVWLTELPASPEKVLRALESQ
ncbi:MAG: molybdopterin-dependent oxidoreductase [Desulfobacterales bacterium]|nr:molybdopterin-dependent oxidoreductase [Desulfobacterales bacterium]